MNHARKAKHGWILTLFFSIVSVLYLYPIVMVVINSFKKKPRSVGTFPVPRDRMFVGLENYVRGLEKQDFAGLWLDCAHYGVFCGADYSVLLHVCLVYQSGEDTGDKNHLYAVPFCHGCAFPDGNVYVVQNRQYAETRQSLGAGDDLSGLWSRAGGLYVYGICEVHSPGN